MGTWEDYKKTMVRKADLWSCAREGDLATLTLLIENGEAVNAVDHRGYSPLMLAAYSSQKQASELLLAHGADVNSSDAAGNSILMGACFKGDLEIVELLVAAGADLTHRNLGAQDAYEIAQTFGRVAILDFLEKKGVQKKKSSRLLGFTKLLLSRFSGMFKLK